MVRMRREMAGFESTVKPQVDNNVIKKLCFKVFCFVVETIIISELSYNYIKFHITNYFIPQTPKIIFLRLLNTI